MISLGIKLHKQAITARDMIEQSYNRDAIIELFIDSIYLHDESLIMTTEMDVLLSRIEKWGVPVTACQHEYWPYPNEVNWLRYNPILVSGLKRGTTNLLPGMQQQSRSEMGSSRSSALCSMPIKI